MTCTPPKQGCSLNEKKYLKDAANLRLLNYRMFTPCQKVLEDAQTHPQDPNTLAKVKFR